MNQIWNEMSIIDYQWKVDVSMLNTVKNVLADVSNISNCSDAGLMLKMAVNIFFYGIQHTHINLAFHCIC